MADAGAGAGAVIATWVTFFIVSIAAGRLGVVFPRYLALPLISGYLVVGAIAGPFVLGIIQKPDLPRLGYVTQFALAFIAFSAGAELYLPELRSLFKRIMYMTTAIAVVTFIVCTALIMGLAEAGLVPFLSELPLGCRGSVATIAASIMVARSPASAIAVVKELKAKGTFTSTLLGCTVACDVYVLLMFTLTTTIAESECKGEGFSGAALGIMVGTILASLLLGWVVGKLLLVLMWFKRIPTRYLILPLGLAIFVATSALTEYSHDNLPYVISLEPLLICIAGGYVCTNQSRHRGRFIRVLQQAGPYVFLPFFTLTGASLDLRVLLQSFGFAAIVAVARAVSIFVGSASGGWAAGQPRQHNMLMWMTLLTQAGVSLGLASEVGMSFPDWGRSFQTAIIAVVVINQILGPILFKIAVRRVGEAGKGGGGDEADEDAAVPTALVVGTTPQALAVAIRLLKARWLVKVVAATDADAAAARAAIARYRDEAEAAEARARGALVHAVTSASTAAVAEIKDGLKLLQDKAAGEGGSSSSSSSSSGSSSASSNAADGGAGTGASAAPAAPPPAQHPAVDEHGHRVRRLDDGLEVMALLPDGTDANDNPFLSDVAALASLAAAAPATPLPAPGGAAPAAGSSAPPPASAAVTGGGQDFRYARLVTAVASGTRTLQAVAVCLPSDATCFGAARALSDAIAGAPKRSPLHSVRLAVTVASPAWGPAYACLGGVIPVHAGSAAAHLAGVLLTAPLVLPVVPGFPHAPTKDELAKAADRTLLEGPHYWRVLGSEAAALPPPVAALLAARAAAHTVGGAVAAAVSGGSSSGGGDPGGGASSSTTTAASSSSSSGLAALTKSVLSLGAADAEEVPPWQRDEYLSALSGALDDNAALAPSVLAARVSEQDRMEMYGSVEEGRGHGAGGESDGESDGVGGGGRRARGGLAARDGNAAGAV